MSQDKKILFKTTLEKIRQRLLDLSKNNPLINYQPSHTRTIYIDTDISVDILHQKLVLDSQMLRLIATDETIETTENHRLPTQHEIFILDKNCKKLAYQAKIALEETGSNILYLALSILHWYPDANKTEQLQAPLLLMPIKCIRQRLSGYPIYQYSVLCQEEEVIVNPCLAEKLRQDYQVKLPEFTEYGTPSLYIEMVKQLLTACLPNWQISKQVLLDLFSFSRLLMYRDLDSQYWIQYPLTVNSQIQSLLLNTPLNNAADVSIEQRELPLVLEADSSQQAVLNAVVNGEAQILVEGPPGTGKSQTISNLIAVLLAQGKSILFVAEKEAALNVVKQRLRNAKLGDFCLDLHSHKTHKSQIYQALQQRMQTEYEDAVGLDKIQQQLAAQKKNYKVMPLCSQSRLNPRKSHYMKFYNR